MRHFIASLVVCLAFVTPISLAQEYVERENDSDVSNVRNDNAKMNAAMSQAYDTLPVFFEALSTGEYDREGFMMKVLTEVVPETYEHMWVIFVDMDEEYNMRGILTHSPYAEGSEHTVGGLLNYTPERISDWRYIEDGKLRGDFTTRVLLETMPLELSSKYAVDYHESPLPPWAKTE